MRACVRARARVCVCLSLSNVVMVVHLMILYQVNNLYIAQIGELMM